MINMFPDSTLVRAPSRSCATCRRFGRARDADRPLLREPRELCGSIARLQTVVDTYPLYSKSDQVLIGIGDALPAGARSRFANLPGAMKERLRAVYQDRAAAAYTKVITRYPMAPHVKMLATGWWR